MKKFDFKMCAAGHPVVTKAGLKVRILCTDRVGANPPIVALVGEEENISTFDKYGRGVNCLYHLVMVPETIKRYYNVYTDKEGELVTGALCTSIAGALAELKCIKQGYKFLRREEVEVKA